MFVSGFTIIRNAVKYDYPVTEAIRSILPVCDEVIVLVGQSDDDTLKLIQSIGSEKIKIHHSVWDDQLREGGKVLAVETDKAFHLVDSKADWCFYIQADEVFPETSIDALKQSMEKYVSDPTIDGLLFNYKHFFGSFNFVAISRTFYRHEIRVIKNNRAITSYRDAQGFRKNGEKLTVAKSHAYIYHYGWVRHPKTMSEKIKNFHQYWHSDEWIQAQKELNAEFDYNGIDAISRFELPHPAVMEDRINRKNWDFKPNLKQQHTSLIKKLLFWFEVSTGYRIGEYKNYKLKR